jgi:hypothetical protein
MINGLVTSKVYLFVCHNSQEFSVILNNIASYAPFSGTEGLIGNYGIIINNGTVVMMEFYNRRIFFDGHYGNLHPIEVTSSEYPLVEGTGSLPLSGKTYPIWSVDKTEHGGGSSSGNLRSPFGDRPACDKRRTLRSLFLPFLDTLFLD